MRGPSKRTGSLHNTERERKPVFGMAALDASPGDRMPRHATDKRDVMHVDFQL
jgi:hypothetical protein